MNGRGSKSQRTRVSLPKVANVPRAPTPEQITAENPEFTAALSAIVSAFVDLGFGASAAQYARRAANEPRRLIEIAEEFHGNSA